MSDDARDGHIGEKVPEEPPTEVERLREQVKRLQTEPVCLLAGPGRGDCFNYVGLPGHSIPGQHDGDDDTVDVYGKPNGWCWHCWHTHERSELQRQLREANRQVEQLQVQIAGCLTAAEGATDPEQVAKRGDYGWSEAYEQTLQLRRHRDRLRGHLDALFTKEVAASRAGGDQWDRLRDGVPEVGESEE